MYCKECGAKLPYNVYGNIKCQSCNAQNFVPIPEKDEANKGAVKREVNKVVVEKDSPKKGLPGWLILGVLILLAVSTSYYLGLVAESKTVASSTITTPAPTTYALVMNNPNVPVDAIDLLPLSIEGYVSEVREIVDIENGRIVTDYIKECGGSAASAIYTKNENDVWGEFSVYECESIDDAKREIILQIQDTESNSPGVEFRDIILEDNIIAKGFCDPENQECFIGWQERNFVVLLTASDIDGNSFKVGSYLASSVILQSPF